MIELLPDSVANQIAAGEVVQRPASVVKELLENAIDAKASQITLVIKDAGRTLIQVVDNGCGMSDVDARMSFERHATSKIRSANDLEHISTFGFRGEALASIASVAEVELKTCREGEEIGTRILIQGSNFVVQEAVQCPVGSSFSVKNLFFNIPARRKFLKSDSAELRHIISEFQRVSICNPEIEFTFINNDISIYTLYKGNLRQRLMALFNKSINNTLIDVKVDTVMIKVSGFVGKPETARKTLNEQFFFVNNRFFKSPYFQKAVFSAYDQLLPKETYPSFFLFFELDPSRIDVNIHPAKTEVKFDEEQGIWQIINAAVRESLSRFAVTPSIIFDTEGAIDIPVMSRDTNIIVPTVKVDTSFNPFHNDGWKEPKKNIKNWEDLYGDSFNSFVSNFESEPQNPTEVQTGFDNMESEINEKRFLQIKGKYILTPVKSGVMLIDIYRAHQRILFEHYLNTLENKKSISRKELYPIELSLETSDYLVFIEAITLLQDIGFHIQTKDGNKLIFEAFPAEMENVSLEKLVDEIIREMRDEAKDAGYSLREKIALSLARTEALRHAKDMMNKEMESLVDRLFACNYPNVSADGKPVLTILTIDELEKRLQK